MKSNTKLRGGLLPVGSFACGFLLKNKMTRKLIVLATVMTVCGAALFAQSEADFTVELTEDGEGVVITSYTGTVTAVKIPAAIQGMPVREIGGSRRNGRYMGAFQNNKSTTSVVIPEGVTIIRANGFMHDYPGGDKLTQVTLPSTLQIIEDGAFDSNKGLKSIVIPKGVTKIGDAAFRDCSSLASITLPETLIELGADAFGSTAITSITLSPNLTKIAGGTFANCKKLVSVIIPEGLSEIGDNAWRGRGGTFSGCTALTSVTLPSTIKKIGDKAFSGCSALTTITIPDTVESIEMSEYSGPFEGCGKVNLASQARLKKAGYKGRF